MQKLTLRGIRLRRAIEGMLKPPRVIESYPGAAQDILCIPRKQKSLELLREGLRRLGLRGAGLETRSHEAEEEDRDLRRNAQTPRDDLPAGQEMSLRIVLLCAARRASWVWTHLHTYQAYLLKQRKLSVSGSVRFISPTLGLSHGGT